MQNHTNQTTRRSAIFVDFDNVYLCLKNQDEQLADDFAKQPDKWLDWLEGKGDFSSKEGEPTRRILSRKCYLNPNSFGNYRPYFVRNAFETIDCPPLTRQGKTSTDGHMMVDIMELLFQPTMEYDEFIILSADADFTPVLLKLRKHDRRTTVMAMGNVSPAYKAACDQLLDQDAVIKALFPDQIAEETEEIEQPEPTGSRKKVITAFVKNLTSSSSTPLKLAIVAKELRQNFPELSEDWLGNGSMKRFLATLDLAPIHIIDSGAGFLCDPDKHTCPAGPVIKTRASGFDQVGAGLQELAQRVHDITDTPLLAPEQYRQILECIAEEVNRNGYHLCPTSKNVRDTCLDMEIPVSRRVINFVLHGICFSGHRFKQGEEKTEILAAALFQNTVTLCENSFLNLNNEEQGLMQAWLGGTA